MKDWMYYEKIQELKRNKLNKTQTSQRLGIDRKTVAKYWDIPPTEFSKKRPAMVKGDRESMNAFNEIDKIRRKSADYSYTEQLKCINKAYRKGGIVDKIIEEDPTILLTRASKLNGELNGIERNTCVALSILVAVVCTLVYNFVESNILNLVACVSVTIVIFAAVIFFLYKITKIMKSQVNTILKEHELSLIRTKLSEYGVDKDK